MSKYSINPRSISIHAGPLTRIRINIFMARRLSAALAGVLLTNITHYEDEEYSELPTWVAGYFDHEQYWTLADRVKCQNTE